MADKKRFIADVCDIQGFMIARHETDLEDNPAYGEEYCRLYLANDPKAQTVTLVEKIKEDKENNITHFVERMRFSRHIDRQTVHKVMENWHG